LRDAAFSGIFLGLGSLVKGIACPLSLPVSILLLWQRRKRLLSSAVGAFLFLLCFTGALAPWAVRNYLVFGGFAPVGTMGGVNLSMGNYAHTPLHNSWAAVEVRGEKSWGYVYREEIAGLNEDQRQKKALQLARQYMLEHPGQTLQRSLVKLANFWGLERTIIAGMKDGIFPALSSRTLQVVLIPVILIPYIIIVLAGFFGLLWRLLYDRHPFDLVFALIVLGVTAMHSLIFGHSRYHLFLMPVLCGYCSWALFNIRFFWQSHRRRAFSVACPVLLMFGSFWTYDVLIGSQDKISQFLENLF
jgi:hypothetical protein